MYKHFFKRLFDLIIALFALPFVLLLILITNYIKKCGKRVIISENGSC